MGATAVRGPFQSVDWTGRANGHLGNGWVNGYDWDPLVYDPLGVRGGALVVTNARARAVTYATDQTDSVTPDGALQGIGCIWRSTNIDAPTVSATWGGYCTPAAWVEVAPLVHVVPGSDEHGMGVWASQLLGVGFLIVGSITNPSEAFHPNVLAGAFFDHTTGTQRSITIDSDGAGVIVAVDDAQVPLNNGFGMSRVPVPSALRGSRLHGVALDAHLTTDWESVPTIPGAFDLSIS